MSITIHPRNNDDVELNVSNTNFEILEQLLLLNSDEDGCGSIDAKALEENLNRAKQLFSIAPGEWTRSYSESHGDGGARVIEMPLRREQIVRYFERIEKIIQVAKENSSVIDWS